MENRHVYIGTIIGVTCCRFLLAIVFIFSGFIKANDPIGTVYKIQDYLEAWHISQFIPNGIPYLGAIIMAVFEFALGFYLLFGLHRKITPILLLLFMGCMTPLTLWLAITAPISDCGCFGDAIILSNWETFWKNIILLIAAIIVFKWRKTLIVKFVSNKVDWIIALYGIVFIIVYTIYCSYYLPVFDFRPYHIGANIPEGMKIPEGEKPTTYETTFIYSKDGKEQEFTIDNYPTDSTWTFIDSKTRIKEQGYEPPVKDFYIADLNTDESLTDRILSDSNYVFLLVMHRVEEADDGNIDLINEIYDYSVEHGYAFYALTSSPRDAIELWSDRTGGEYPFGIMDDITLKTIIRSNPGLLLLKGGTILNKWSDNRLPDEYVLTDSLDKLPLGHQKPVSDGRTMGYVLLWFILPLLAVIALDVLVVKRRARRKAREQLSFEKEENIH